MFDRLLKAVIEGRLLKSSIGKMLQEVFLFVDAVIGDVFLYLYMRKTSLNNNQIMFKTFQGEYVCNEKYISEKVMEKLSKYKIVWVHNSEQNGGMSSCVFPAKVVVVEDNSLDFYRELASSRIIIINSYLTLHRKVKLKKEQILLETWHGSLGIKKPIRNKCESQEWLAAMRRTAKLTTYVISNSGFENIVYKDTFWKERQIVQWGHARNDILFETVKHQEIKDKVYNTYKIPREKKMVLYAPTYRLPYTFGQYMIDAAQTLAAMEAKWGGEWVFAVKYHPSLRNLVQRENRLYGEQIVDLTEYTDMQEVLIAADAGISDYSSWMFDYLFLERPCFIYARDLEEYKESRGLYYPIQKTPFPLSGDMKELLENIAQFDTQRYINDIREFLSWTECMESGNACDAVVDFISAKTQNRKENITWRNKT